MPSASEGQVTPGPDLAPLLLGLLRRDGIGLLEQRGRLTGLLRDYAPGAIRDIRLLLGALDSGAPARLRAAPDPMAGERLSDEADRMVASFGCDRALALDAVTTWGRTLAGWRGSADAAPATHPEPSAARSTGGSGAVRDDPQHDPSVVGPWVGTGVVALLVLAALCRWIGWI